MNIASSCKYVYQAILMSYLIAGVYHEHAKLREHAWASSFDLNYGEFLQ